jgi:GDP-L-fucose synthase
MDTFPGWAKRMGELQVQAYRIEHGLENFAVVRPSNVYGPGDNFDPATAMVIPALMSRIRNGEDPVVVWGDGSAVRDFIYSEDVARGMLLALYQGTDSRPVNLGSGVGVSVTELVETLKQVVPFSYRFDPSKPGGFPRRVMDMTLARRRLGFVPTTSLASGLRQTWDWYVTHSSEHLMKQNYFTGRR